MRSLVSFVILMTSMSILGQSSYETPKDGQIPEKLQGIPVGIQVKNFPEVNHPIKIGDTYYWKHTTAFISNDAEITITEFGAYIYYNAQWNLRKSYDLKDLDTFFGTKEQVVERAHPYVWEKNWRIGSQLFGGWALWYFIGQDSDGETICGYATIHTTDHLLN